MRKFLIISIFGLFLCVFTIFYNIFHDKITIEFEKIRPLSKNVKVYYGGFEIGHVKKVRPCKHSTSACVSVSIKKDNFFIPKNSYAKFKQKRIHERLYEDYIELVYPDNPSYFELKNGDLIKGKVAAGFHNYMNEEVEYTDMEELKMSLLNSAQNLDKLTGLLIDLISSLDMTVNLANDAFKNISPNFNSAAKSINSAASKLNNSIKEEDLSNIIQNTENISKNLSEATEAINSVSKDIQNSDLLNSANSAIKSTDEILNGVRCNLKKPFGFFRVLFGKNG